MRKAIFVGSFDPFTIGHRNIVERALKLFDEIIIGIGINPDKTYKYSLEERLRRIEAMCSGFKGVRVQAYDDMTTDFAHRYGAEFIVKGVRNAEDFSYELMQADYNREQGRLETVWLPAVSDLRHVSSTWVKANSLDNE